MRFYPMNERSQLQDLTEQVLFYGGIVFIILLMTISSLPPAPPAPIESNVTIAVDSPPWEIPTTPPQWTHAPTPAALPAVDVVFVDPFVPGLRSENQWYKWYRPEVSGLKDLQIGIVCYRHAFLDRYTWWNPSTGNYFTQRPTLGNRFFIVWVHEEMIGTSPKDDPSFWSFDERAFALQVGNEIMPSQMNTTYNPVLRIKELDEKTDYYDTITAPPFGYYVKYTGHAPQSGGFEAQKLGWLRMGKGNAIDGYIIYEVPRETQIRDVQLLGEFGTFGNVIWRF
jgi:hypothetical protein